MHSTALKAKDISKTNTRPLRVFHSAITTVRVARQCLDNRLVVSCHLNHGETILFAVAQYQSITLSMMRRLHGTSRLTVPLHAGSKEVDCTPIAELN